MNLLRLITWPYVRKHLLRSVLTTAGIVLGVALLVGMQTANRSVLLAFSQTVDRIAGKAQLEVSAGDTGFPEDALERVQGVKEVSAAAPVIESSVDTGLHGQGRLLILAVDMTGDRSLRDYDFENGDQDVIDDPLVFLAQPDSLLVTREFADRNGLRSGSRVTFDTMEGRKQFTIRGILKAGGMAQAFGGNLGIIDIYAAQKVFGRGRRFDRIDIGLQEGVTLQQGEAALRGALGPGFTVEPPSNRGAEFESLLSVYTVATGISSLFALFIGMFIIYNSFAIAVTQRRAEIGILRALGATRGQIRGLFLGESAVLGLIGAAVGVLVGIALSHVLTGVTGNLMETMYGVANHAEETVLDPRLLVLAMIIGTATSMLAAWVPARNAAKVQPVQALQKGKYQVLSAGENRIRKFAAVLAAVAAVVCLPASGYGPAFVLGYLAAVLTGLLLTPYLSVTLARWLRYPLKWLRPVEGALAADSLIQAPRRTSATVAALMLSLALVIGQGGVARGSYQIMDRWLSTALNPDLFVSTSETLSGRQFHFPAVMQSELAAIPGIDEVQAVRTARVQYRGLPMMIVAADLDRIGKRVHGNLIAGDPATAHRDAGAGKGVLVADNLAELLNLHVGDPFELQTPTGPLRLPVLGILRDLSNQLGTVFLDRSVFIRYYQDDTADIFRVYLKPGASAPAVRQQIIEQVGNHRRLFVMLNREVHDYARKMTGVWFGMTYIQVVVAVAVAILGIVNTLTVSIADRRRELGVLRAAGGLRSQIRRTIWLEAIAIGVIGLALGVAIGAVHLYYAVQAIHRHLSGIALPYAFPLEITAILIPVILAAAFASAVLPAEAAVRSSLVEALEYE
jgi:putative ABC transport system permease protein